MLEDIQELLAKYRDQRTQALHALESGNTGQSAGYWNGKIRALDEVIEDLRELVLSDRRAGA